MDKLELFNAVINKARPASNGEVKANSLDNNVSEIGVDSLDLIMISIYFSEIYGVSEETAKTLEPKTVREFFELYEANSTKNPQSIKEAIGNIEF